MTKETAKLDEEFAERFTRHFCEPLTVITSAMGIHLEVFAIIGGIGCLTLFVIATYFALRERRAPRKVPRQPDDENYGLA